MAFRHDCILRLRSGVKYFLDQAKRILLINEYTITIIITVLHELRTICPRQFSCKQICCCRSALLRLDKSQTRSVRTNSPVKEGSVKDIYSSFVICLHI
jgi:hypothetical protein